VRKLSDDPVCLAVSLKEVRKYVSSFKVFTSFAKGETE